ncbi:MAG: hypothetical protein M0Z66_04795 [Thermaerobacter sp.]|nr:hypothetical protein [Thermaerobacter sp.]
MSGGAEVVQDLLADAQDLLDHARLAAVEALRRHRRSPSPSRSLGRSPSCSATDSLSGVDTVEASVYAQAATNGEAIQLWQLPLGPVPFTVTTIDNAGNIGNQTVTFTMTASIASMEDLVGRFVSTGLIANRGLAKSLTAKLRAAEASQSRGDQAAAANELGAFVNEVNAQAGKGVAPVAAAVLLRDAQYILASWEG